MDVAPSTTAGIITAIATVLTAMGGLVLALSVLIPTLRSARRAEATAERTHVIVNQERTDAQRYREALIKALRANDIEVPDDQSLLAAPVAPPVT